MSYPFQEIVVLQGMNLDPKTIEDFVLNSEKHKRQIQKPQNKEDIKTLRKVVYNIISDRLIRARNRPRSNLDNDKINRMMLDSYKRRKRPEKTWAFTNAISGQVSFLDEEEVTMMAEILDINEDVISLHIKVIPWALEDQKKDRAARRARDANKRERQIRETAPTPNPYVPAENNTQNKKSDPAPVCANATPAVKQAEKRQAPYDVGNINISHSDGVIHISGRIWCGKKEAFKLQMVLPLKLLTKGKKGDPDSYEVRTQVHPYQLYNIMHVLYGIPRVVAVEQ